MKHPQAPDHLISLAEASRKTGRILTRGAFSELDTGATPTLADLAEALNFALGDGRIWLNDQRMLLIQSLVLGRLRQEIIDAFGIETAKGLFMRVGYMQGVRDAELIQKRFAQEDLTHALAAGPRVHTLEGFVKVTTKQFQFDLRKGTYFGEFYWDDSSEAAEHLSSYGIASEPVCWMQIGYPSGYTSTLFGKPVVFREIECAAMGAPRCFVVGQHADAWGDGAPERQYLGLDWSGRRPVAVNPGGPTSAAKSPTVPDGQVVGVSASFLRTRLMLEKVADTDATVLFIGESGVGKELFSNELHRLSPRQDKPFVPINCAAIPEALVESELFGVEKGAFTGAIQSRPGYFERAHGGTLFLDEIASLTYSAQGKVLRAIQERKIERVGGTRTIPVDVRVVTASNVDLAAEVRGGRFRQDLYFRLCVFPIVIPPLRDRRDDIPLLAAHFLTFFRDRHRRDTAGFTRRAMDALLAYDFPGNIRELQNLVERGVILSESGSLIDLQHMFTGFEMMPSPALKLTEGGRISTASQSAEHREDPGHPITTPDALKRAEAELYVSWLAAAGGNVSAAARQLGITRAKLEYRLRKLGQLD
ncbi:sigma-54-dependent Fis family transcriptional regulator [Rhizobium skierniewicense]|uniref:sigma-54-dependent Fis family transcriptional regulator n=1 Tax=Rhizobium skierniewicense TaxID=984260 RepID=UPI0015729D38|nr:sigma-54-dependent Fis family transcriptional regulator [Rhizobium skierniewicense]NTF33076.1 sigma-54-dependent Fis family transcriptional regulator [Rhizobium skierniewicense]